MPGSRTLRTRRKKPFWRSESAAASMVTYSVAAALFVIGTGYLLQFTVDPPGTSTSSLQHANLRTVAQRGVEVILGGAGYPANWDADADHVQQLGLIESGTTLRVNPEKFDALARGQTWTYSEGNAGVDYYHAKQALGLADHDFHLRAYPSVSPALDGPYGVNGMSGFRVAYVGDFTGADLQSIGVNERDALAALGIGFDPARRHDATPGAGDVYADSLADVREHLLPGLGTRLPQVALSPGTQTPSDFRIVPASAYSAYISGANGSALALSADGTTLSYAKSREIRAIVGEFPMTGVSAAKLDWQEWVDSDAGTTAYDCNDHGLVEVSPDNGVTWYTITAGVPVAPGLPPAPLTGTTWSADCTSTSPLATPHAPAYRERAAANIVDDCGACANADRVLVAVRWVADNDNAKGRGWVLDDLRVVVGTDIVLNQTFEPRYYNMVIVGSNAASSAFNSLDVKHALRDYIDFHGGRLLVLGGQTSTSWLDDLLAVNLVGGGGAPVATDATHPLLTLPNTLTVKEDTPRAALDWDLTGSNDRGRFVEIVGPGLGLQTLTVSRPGAYGGASALDGGIILSSYQPGLFADAQEARRFLANTVVYGKYHSLYLELGPPVPANDVVASFSRTATMNKIRSGVANYTEIVFVMHVWSGTTAASYVTPVGVPPMPVRNLAAATSGTSVTLTWQWPTSNGTGTPFEFVAYRRDAPDGPATTFQLPVSPALATHTWTDTSATPGREYHYTVTLDAGARAADVGGAPRILHGAPTGATATTAGVPPGYVKVTWIAPTTPGAGTVYGYEVLREVNGTGGWSSLGEVGNTTEFLHAVPYTGSYRYQVKALGAAGYGPLSAESNAATPPVAANAPVLAVSNAISNQLRLTWVAPTDLGTGALQGYRIHRSLDGTAFTELTYVGNPAATQYDDIAVDDGTQYWYKVQAVTSVGDGLLSEIATATTHDVPGQVLNVRLVNRVLGVHTTIEWDVPASDGGTPITSYRVYRGATPGTETYIGNGVGTLYVDTSTTPAYYRVAAVNGAGEGPLSASTFI